MITIPNMSLFVTSKCNVNCRYCSQKHWRAKGYEFSIETVELFVRAMQESDYRTERIILSGGEPTLWLGLPVALSLLREVSNTLTVFTNGTLPYRIEKIIHLVDHVRISNYNIEAVSGSIHSLWKKYGKEKVEIVDRQEFLIPPLEPLPNTTPAECGCRERCVVSNRIYVCGQVFEILSQLGKDTDLYSVPISEHFHFALPKFNYGNEDVCCYCIYNQTINRHRKGCHRYYYSLTRTSVTQCRAYYRYCRRP
jgi:hypothetical protein